jgi:hypothetical protein
VFDAIVVAGKEHAPDMCRCSDCGKKFKIRNLKTEQDGDWESGYYNFFVCPKCPDGGCIDDYWESAQGLKDWNKLLNSNIREFKHNVFCRNESNQHKATKLWHAIKCHFPQESQDQFPIEWSHYLTGELTTEEFGFYFKKYMKKA